MGQLFLHPHADAPSLDREIADWVATRLAAGLAERGAASLVVSGGRTPTGFFRLLREAEIDWPRVTITLADERWVAPDHEDSNERLLREHLLQGRAAAATFIPLKFEAADPVEGARLASEALAGVGEFDVVILGMGEDGHTASLFPDSPQLAEGLASDEACLATENATKAPRWRITLTAPRIARARALALHITGMPKWALLGEIVSGSDPHRYPIRILFNQTKVDRHVFWCC